MYSGIISIVLEPVDLDGEGHVYACTSLILLEYNCSYWIILLMILQELNHMLLFFNMIFLKSLKMNTMDG